MQQLPQSKSFFQRELHDSFLAPLNSLRFFKHHKFLLVIGLAPHLAGLCAYAWFLFWYAMPYAQQRLLGWNTDFSEWATKFFIGTLVLIVGAVLYTILLMPVVNALASPIYDIIATQAYQECSGYKLPRYKTSELVRSFVSECSKSVFIVGVFTVAFFLPLAAPVFFILSIWFFGWDHMDRTLSLMGFGIGKRIRFGLKHSLACISLGVWTYIPFAGTLLSFVMSAAGAIAVVGVQSKKDVINLGEKTPA